jgi:hypothetical protein
VWIFWQNSKIFKKIGGESWKHNVAYFEGYANIRAYKLDNPLYPTEVIMLDKIEHSNINRKYQ